MLLIFWNSFYLYIYVLISVNVTCFLSFFGGLVICYLSFNIALFYFSLINSSTLVVSFSFSLIIIILFIILMSKTIFYTTCRDVFDLSWLWYQTQSCFWDVLLDLSTVCCSCKCAQRLNDVTWEREWPAPAIDHEYTCINRTCAETLCSSQRRQRLWINLNFNKQHTHSAVCETSFITHTHRTTASTINQLI